MEIGYDIVKSAVLGETIVVGDMLTYGDIPRQYKSSVIYSNREAQALQGLDDDTMRSVHLIKKVFHGHILPRAKNTSPRERGKRKLPLPSVWERIVARDKHHSARKDLEMLQEPSDDAGEPTGDDTEHSECQARLDRKRRALASLAALPVGVGGRTDTTATGLGATGMGEFSEQELF